MNIDHTLQKLWSETDQGWQADIPTSWSQGRSVFGGLTTAFAIALARRHMDAGRALRTVSVHLLRPASPGLVQGSCRVLREGRNVTFLETRLLQQDKEVALVTMVFVNPRDSDTRVEGPPMPSVPPPDDFKDMPYYEGLTPEFTNKVSFRFAKGNFPYSGSKEAKTGGYCRFRVPFGDEEGLVALMDVWPCPSLALLTDFAPASTVSWTAHLLEVPDDFEGWFYFDYETIVGAAGFHTAVGHLYAPNGRLVGWTEQLVAVFD